jgi:hypothetical protein
MMNLAVRLTGNEPVTVKVTPKVVVAAERQFKQPMAQLFSADSMSYEVMAWVAWKAMHTAGHVVKTFDLWLDDLETVEFTAVENDGPLGDAGA